jgi:hypothetical protein
MESPIHQVKRDATPQRIYTEKYIWIMIALLHPDPHPPEYLQRVLYRWSLVRELESSFSLFACDLHGIAEIVRAFGSPLGYIETVSLELVSDNEEEKDRNLVEMRQL